MLCCVRIVYSVSTRAEKMAEVRIWGLTVVQITGIDTESNHSGVNDKKK